MQLGTQQPISVLLNKFSSQKDRQTCDKIAWAVETKFSTCFCRDKYETVIKSLNVRPLRIQAGQNVVVRATEDGLVVVEDEDVAGAEAENAAA